MRAGSDDGPTDGAPFAATVFRPRALASYLVPELPREPPGVAPARFARLWLLIALLVAAGAACAWVLASRLEQFSQAAPPGDPRGAALPSAIRVGTPPRPVPSA